MHSATPVPPRPDERTFPSVIPPTPSSSPSRPDPAISAEARFPLPARVATQLLRAYSHVAPTERGGYRLARLARGFVPPPRRQGRFTIPGSLQLDLDLNTYPDCCMAYGIYELDTRRLLRKLLKPGSWFVDCGANLGYFTLCAARWCTPQGRVDAYEPDPQNRQRLETHLQINGLAPQVRVHPLGLSDQTQTLTLYHPQDDQANHGMSSVYCTNPQAAQSYTISCVRLEDQLQGVPDVIKMDIEGSELPALRGMARLLAAPTPPRLIIEHNAVSAQAAGYRSSDIFRYLLATQPRYRVYWIGSSLTRIPTPEALDAISRQGNLLIRVD